jgi:hypothetical protein
MARVKNISEESVRLANRRSLLSDDYRKNYDKIFKKHESRRKTRVRTA